MESRFFSLIVQFITYLIFKIKIQTPHHFYHAYKARKFILINVVINYSFDVKQNSGSKENNKETALHSFSLSPASMRLVDMT